MMRATRLQGRCAASAPAAPLAGLPLARRIGAHPGARRRSIARDSPPFVTTQQQQERPAGDAAGVESTTSNATIAPSQQEAADQQTFQWFSNWYPVMHLEGLNPKVPRHVDLLGKSLVLWADSQGRWHCMEDLCPHRLAPLSEGRVEGDSLQCSYHGWAFNAQGACTNIPQIPPGPARDKACGDRKARAAAYPTTEAHGLLWVWPEAGPAVAQKAAATPAGEQVSVKDRIGWFRREIPNRVVTQLENVLDPSHVPFVHHGVQGNRYRVESHTSWANMTTPQVSKSGFTTSTTNAIGKAYLSYRAPYLVQYSYERPGMDKPVVGIQVILVPSRPGYCVIYGNFMPQQALARAPKPLKGLLIWLSNTWLGKAIEHGTNRNAVLDGDCYMLHVLERKQPLSAGVGLGVVRDYFVPGACDGGVLALRQWLSQYGGDVPTCTPADAALEPPLMSKEQVLDRYSQHTKDCAHCRRAVETIDLTRQAAVVLASLATFAALAACVTAAVLPRTAAQATAASGAVQGWWQALLPAVAVGLAVAAGALWLRSRLAQFRTKFFYEEYTHALRD